MEQGEGDGTYTRFVSHQLKSPINAIQSLLKTVTEGYTGELSAQAKYTIEKAIARAGEASGIVSALLDFERYSAEGGIERKEMDIIPVLESLAAIFTVSASEKDISMQTEIPRDVGIYLKGDSHAFEQAVRNLLENAVKYTPRFGEVRLRCSPDPDGGSVRIAVEDTGEGVPKEEQDLLFTPFFRSRKQKKSKPGTGLGLAIVKRIVEAHGGEIRAESEEGTGTSFYMDFPLLRVEERKTDRAPKHRVLIIGGVTSGPKTASRLRRLNEDAEITIIEDREFLSYSGCELPSYLGSRSGSAAPLVTSPSNRVRNARFFHAFKNITVFNNTRAINVDREERLVTVEDRINGGRRRLPYDTLVIAAGAKPDLPDIPGIDCPNIFTVYSLEDARKLQRQLSAGPAQEGFIIGGGLIGATLAESLLQRGVRITVLEKKPHILGAYFDGDMAGKLENLFSRKGIRILTGVTIEEIRKEGAGLSVRTRDGTYYTDFVICSTGVRPRTELAEPAGLKLGPSGGIAVDGGFRTSDNHIFAVGDCAESIHPLSGVQEYWPLGSVSTKMGRLAADAIGGKEVNFSGFLGTTMLRCFELQVARTGLTGERARELGFPAESVVISGTDKPEYKEDSGTVFFNICFNADTGKLYGAQAFGSGNAAGKISLAAACISAGMTLNEIYALDLGYAPEFTHPVDIFQTACAVGKNKLDGLIETAGREQVESYRQNGTLVSITPEPGSGRFLIPGSMEIPPEQVRAEGIPFDKDSEILLYCRTSALAYEASRYLKSSGYTAVKVLEGGYLFWEL